MTQAALMGIWDQIKAGERIVVSDSTLGGLDDWFAENDGPDADLYFHHCVSVPNPQRCGILDEFVAFLKGVPT